MYQKEFCFLFSRVNLHSNKKWRWLCQRLVCQKSEFACKIYSLPVKFQEVKFTDLKFKHEIFVRLNMKD